MSVYPLFESARATADANGRAVATFGPQRAFEKWEVTRMTVQNSGTVLVPTARVYRGAETESSLIDGTHTGTLDHSDTNLVLQAGESLIAVWADADVGSTSTITVEGRSVR